MNKLKSSFWINSLFYTVLQRGSLFVFGAFALMLILRGFTKTDYSEWGLYLTTITLFETIKQGLLRNPTIKFMGLQQYAQNQKAVQSAALLINIVTTFLGILLFTVASKWIAGFIQSPGIDTLLQISVLFLILLIPFNHFEILLQANFAFSKIFWAYFARQGLFFGGILILYFFLPQQFTVLNLVYLQIVSLLLGTVILYFQVQPYRIKGFAWNKNIVINMFQFGKFIFGTNLFANISRNFDQYITANALGPAASSYWVANYNLVSRINNMMDVPSLAAADVLFPKNVTAIEEKGLGQVKYYFERMVGTILAVIVPLSLFIFIFPKFVIYILADTNYYSAIHILQVTILFGIVRPISYQYGSTLDAIGKPALNFYTNLLFMAVNLGLTYLALSRFGGEGAAYATVLNNIIIFIIMMLVLKKHVHVETKNIFIYMFQTYKIIFNKILKR